MPAVATLPRQDLAKMAEVLVNLTAFLMQMRMSKAEPVTWPVDVAILSRRRNYLGQAQGPDPTAFGHCRIACGITHGEDFRSRGADVRGARDQTRAAAGQKSGQGEGRG